AGLLWCSFRSVSWYFCFFLITPATSPLHTFPTRRSSDLSCRRVHAGIDHGFETLANVFVAYFKGRLDLVGKVVEHIERPALAFVDRKSTRLNSSHVKISYAVFCLKKKQLTIQTQGRSLAV